MPAKKKVVVSASILSLALIGGVAAQFTASTTSAPQKIGTGTLAIDFQNESAGWTQGISNLAAGDSEVVGVDFVNVGTLDLDDSVRFSVQDSIAGGLSTDLDTTNATDDSLQVRISSDQGIAFVGPVSKLFGQGQVLPADMLGLKAGDSTHLTFTYTVPATAGNAYQNKGANLTYTANVVQRAATSFGDGAVATPGQGGSGNTPGAGVSPNTAPVMNTWTKITSLEPDSGYYEENTLASVGGKLYALAGNWGTAAGQEPAPVRIYDQQSDSWSTGAAAPHGTMGAVPVTTASGKVYVIGGSEWQPTGEYNDWGDAVNQKVLTGYTMRYDTVTDSWAEMAELPVQMNQFAAEEGSDGKIYVFGGQMDQGAVNPDVFVYTPATNTWENRGAMPGNYTAGDTVRIGDDIYYVGGLSITAGAVPPKALKYNVVSGEWTELAAGDDIRLYGSAAVGKDGRIYYVGGLSINAGFTTDYKTYVYDTQADTWADTGSQSPIAMYNNKSASDAAGNVYIINGLNGDSGVYRLS